MHSSFLPGGQPPCPLELMVNIMHKISTSKCIVGIRGPVKDVLELLGDGFHKMGSLIAL